VIAGQTHTEIIMRVQPEIRKLLDDQWIPAIYRDKVRSQRTRAFSLEIPERENDAEILHTLLGIELKVGKRRFACPDLSTARYMRVFARIGCTAFAVPYDITMVPALADELETAWYRLLLAVDAHASGRSAARLRSALLSEVRDELRSAGAGPAMPAFERSTKQRRA
jgi:hypothetical protein